MTSLDKFAFFFPCLREGMKLRLFSGFVIVLACSFACHAETFILKDAESFFELAQKAVDEPFTFDIVMESDIDLSGLEAFPLGFYEQVQQCQPYSGHFDGRGFTIHNFVMIGNTTSNNTGLFCILNGATIENLVIDGSSNFSGLSSGALAAQAIGSFFINNVTSRATVDGYLGGGLVGCLSQSKYQVVSITESRVEGQILSSYESGYLGGFIGAALECENLTIEMTNCVFAGTIQANSNKFYLGGFFGAALECPGFSLNINHCESKGSAESVCASEYTGGFFGLIVDSLYSRIRITESKSNFSISSSGGTRETLSCMGGLMGGIEDCGYSTLVIDSVTASNSISSLKETALFLIGGFVGSLKSNAEFSVIVNNSCFNGNITTRNEVSHVGMMIGRTINSPGITIRTEHCITNGVAQVFAQNSTFVSGFIGNIYSSNNAGVHFTDSVSNSIFDISANCASFGGFIGGVVQCSIITITINGCESHSSSQINVGLCTESFSGGMIGLFTNNPTGSIVVNDLVMNDNFNITSQSNFALAGLLSCATASRDLSISVKNSTNRCLFAVKVLGYNDLHCSGFIGFVVKSPGFRSDISNSISSGVITINSTAASSTSSFHSIIIQSDSVILSTSNCTSNDTVSGSVNAMRYGGYVGAIQRCNTVIMDVTGFTSRGIVELLGDKLSLLTSGLIGEIGETDGAVIDVKHSVWNGHLSGATTKSATILAGFISDIFGNKRITLKFENTSSQGTIDSRYQNTPYAVGGGIIGLFDSNEEMTLILDHCSSKGNFEITAESVDGGGFISRLVNSVNVRVEIKNVVGTGTITINSQGWVLTGGMIAFVENNENMTLLIENSEQSGPIKNAVSSSYTGGFFGLFQNNTNTTVTLSNSIVSSNIRVTPCHNDCINSGFTGYMNNTGSENVMTSLVVKNSAFTGKIDSKSAKVCGFACVDEQSNNFGPSASLINCLNSGSLTGSTVFAMTSASTFVENVVSVGPVKGTKRADIVNELATIKGSSLFVLKGSCTTGNGDECKHTNNVINEIVEDTTNEIFVTTDQKRVDTILNNQSFAQQYGSVWSKRLALVKGIVVNLTHDGKENIVVLDELKTMRDACKEYIDDLEKYVCVDIGTAENETIDWNDIVLHDMDIVLKHSVRMMAVRSKAWIVEHGSRLGDVEEIVTYVSEAKNNSHLVNRAKHQEVGMEWNVTENVDLMLGYSLTVVGGSVFEVGTKVYVEKGKTLGTVKELEQILNTSTLFKVKDNETNVEYLTTTLLDHDVTVLITNICEELNEKQCKSKSQCKWDTGCRLRNESEEIDGENKTGMIVGLTIGCLVAVGCIGAVCFLVFLLMKKRNIEREIFDSSVSMSMYNTGLFDTMNGTTNKTVVVTIGGEEKTMVLCDQIGQGSFAIVWKAQIVGDETNHEYAVKMVDKRAEDGMKDAQKEAMMMEQLDAQFVVAVYGCGFTDMGLAIAMEYFPLGSLQNVLQKDQLPSNARVPMLLDIAKAMEYLHSQGIIHRDLKPGNVLVCSLDPQVHPMCKFVFDHHHLSYLLNS